MIGTSTLGRELPVLLSIVTVTFRNDDGLRRTLESLACLGDIAHQVIVMDGASRPTTRALVACLLPGATIVQEPDDGPYDAMNKGALLATGQWVWFLNAGDTVAPGVTQRQIKGLIGRKDVAVVVGRALRPSGTAWPSDFSATMTGYQPPCHQAVLTSRYLLARPAFDSRLKVAADYDAFLRSCLSSHVHFSPEAICTYEGGGMSSRRRLRLEAELFVIRRRLGLQSLRSIPRDLLRILWRPLRSLKASGRDAP